MLIRRQLQAIRAVLAVGERDVCPDAVMRQLEADGLSATEAAELLAECVADRTIFISDPPKADVLQFPGRGA